MALAHLKSMTNRRKNELIIRFYEDGQSIIDFFHSDLVIKKQKYGLNDKEINLLSEAEKELPNNSFLVEDLLDQGYELIPILSKEYAPLLKQNLKRTLAPPLIYIKGNKQILFEDSIAVVGARNASDISLQFTDNIVKNASKNFNVIVSGFAKGVDKQALDSALKHNGQSIIVLPQGITTFKSGIKKYYKPIVSGDLLVFSTYHPKAPWSVQLAMGRNPTIYGLAKEIYVAESGEKGGTWSGVKDGIKKGRKIYIRYPERSEKNANLLLIEMGAIPVDMHGDLFPYELQQTDHQTNYVAEPDDKEDTSHIMKLLSQGEYTSKQIINKFDLKWKPIELTNWLKNNPAVKALKTKPLKFTLEENADKQQTLF